MCDFAKFLQNYPRFSFILAEILPDHCNFGEFRLILQRDPKGDTDMATPVKIIPTLHGESARKFMERAEERERNPRNISIYTEEEEKAYIKMITESGMPSMPLQVRVCSSMD
jgi:hypothetical protein